MASIVAAMMAVELVLWCASWELGSASWTQLAPGSFGVLQLCASWRSTSPPSLSNISLRGMEGLRAAARCQQALWKEWRAVVQTVA